MGKLARDIEEACKLGKLARDVEEACKLGKTTLKSSWQRNLFFKLQNNKRRLFGVVVLLSVIAILWIDVFTRTTQSLEYTKVSGNAKVVDQTLTPGLDMSTTTQSSILEYVKVLNATYQMQPVTDPCHWLPVMMPFINLTLMESNKPDHSGVH